MGIEGGGEGAWSFQEDRCIKATMIIIIVIMVIIVIIMIFIIIIIFILDLVVN